MIPYREFIEGYESPEYSEDDQAIIDLDIEERLRSRGRHQKSIKLEEQNQSQQSSQEQSNNAEGYPPDLKSYRLLSQVDLSLFEVDIRKGKLSTDQLCQKYRVSRATANRYIKNYKDHGYVKYKKQLKQSKPDKLIKKLLAQNQDLSRRLGRQKGQSSKPDFESYCGAMNNGGQKQQFKMFGP